MADTLPSIEQIAAKFSAGPAAVPEAAAPADGAAAPAAADPAAPAVDPAAAADPLATPAEPVAPKPDPSAARFAALARKDKEIRERTAAAESRERDATARLAAAEAREREAAARAAPKKYDSPIEYLKAGGFSLEDANLAAFGKYAPKPADPVDTKLDERLTPVQAQLKEYQDTVAALKVTLDQLQTERVEAAKRDIRREIVETAKRDGCELIAAVGDDAIVLVQQVMQHHEQVKRERLTYAEACAKVEEYYTDAVSRLAATEKIKAKFASAVPAKATTPDPKPKERPNTLTQAHTPPGSSATPDVNKMSKEEAIAHLSKKLKYNHG